MTAVGYPKDYSYLKINVKYIAKFNTSKKKGLTSAILAVKFLNLIRGYYRRNNNMFSFYDTYKTYNVTHFYYVAILV